jgi:hypothetical protein
MMSTDPPSPTADEPADTLNKAPSPVVDDPTLISMPPDEDASPVFNDIDPDDIALSGVSICTTPEEFTRLDPPDNNNDPPAPP